MNITIYDKLWRFTYDKDVTLEVIGLIFDLTVGESHLLVDDLVELLFILDVNSLLKYYRCVTGLSYYFNAEGRLRSGELYKLFNDNTDKFSIYSNIYNRKVIKYKDTSYIGDDNLCTATEELIREVITDNITELLFSKATYNYLFNVDVGVRQCNKGRIKYITLDYLIDRLDMNKAAIIESLALHNLMLKVV